MTPLKTIFAWFARNTEDLLIGAAVAAIIVAAMLLLREIGRRITSKDPSCTSWRSVIGRVLAKTTLWFMIVSAVAIVMNYAEPAPRIERLVKIAFVIVAALQGAIWGRELIIGVISRRAAEDGEGNALANAMAIIRLLVSVVLFAVAIILILDNLGVNVTALVAGLGIGGIAIGLAAQGIFSDLFAALSILFDKPFKRGDTIRYDQSTATVERIGLKTTRLRSITGEVRVMANTKLLEREIQNFAGGMNRTTYLTFGLVYQTPPELLLQVSELARAAVEERSGCNLVRCEITGLGASSVDFEFIFQSASTLVEVVAADRTAIVVNLMKILALHGIQFAYPTQTTFTAAPDGTLVMPYATPTSTRTEAESHGRG